jgi:hypothetical protein
MLTRGAQMRRRTATQGGPRLITIVANINALVACPDGKE